MKVLSAILLLSLTTGAIAQNNGNNGNNGNSNAGGIVQCQEENVSLIQEIVSLNQNVSTLKTQVQSLEDQIANNSSSSNSFILPEVGDEVLVTHAQRKFNIFSKNGKTLQAQWSLNDQAMGTISNTGLFIPAKSGRVVITAELNGESITKEVQVIGGLSTLLTIETINGYMIQGRLIKESNDFYTIDTGTSLIDISRDKISVIDTELSQGDNANADRFKDAALRELRLVTGKSIVGRVRSEDASSIIIDTGSQKFTVFKKSIATISDMELAEIAYGEENDIQFYQAIKEARTMAITLVTGQKMEGRIRAESARAIELDTGIMSFEVSKHGILSVRDAGPNR